MPVAEWERSAILFFQEHQDATLTALMQFFSSVFPWIPLLGWLLWNSAKRLRRIDFFWVFVMSLLLLAVSDSSSSHFFKNLFQRLRPCKIDDLRPLIKQSGQGCGGRWGFFSSHASNAAALVQFLSPFAFRGRMGKIFAWLLVAAVALSRVYLGVHFPLDIIAGLVWGTLLGQAWLFLARHSLTGQVSS